MLGRILVHLPWMSALLLFVAVIALEVFVARPGEEEGARQAAVGALRGRFARDVSLIESALRAKSMEQVQLITSETTGLAGLNVILLADPSGQLLACSGSGLVPGQALPEEPPYDLLRPRAGTDFAPEIIRQPGANIVNAVASIDFSVGGTPGHGLLFEQWNLEPLVAPMIASSRAFAIQLFFLLVLVLVPAQYLVYWFVTRRLQRLAVDAQAFGRGVRKGLFQDNLADQIGAVSTLLREATLDVAEREVAAHRLELALESANAGVWDWDVPGMTIATNDQYHIMLGDTPPEAPLPAESLLARIHPDDVGSVRDMIRRVFKREQPLYSVEFRMRGLRDGQYRWIHSTGRVVEWDDKGRARRMLGQHMDIGALKAVQTHEADLARIVDDSPSEVYVCTTEDLRFLSVNRSAVTNTGYAAVEFLELTIEDVTAPAQRPALAEALDALRRGDALYLRHPSRHLRKDGSTYEVEAIIQLQTFNDQPTFVAIVQDISERVLLQRRFQKLFDGVAHAIMVFDRDVRFIMVNQVASRLFRVRAEQLAGRTLEEFVPDFHTLAKQRIGEVLDARAGREFEDRILIGGVQRWFHTILQPLEDDGGQLSWVQMIAHETTEEKEHEARIHAQQERYRTLVESTSAILWEGDPDTFAFTFVNKEAESVLGYPATAWVEDPTFWPSHIHPADREWAVNYCQTATKAGEEHAFEYRMIAADGRIVWLRDIVSVVKADGRAVKLVGVMIDISREKREEERFQAAFESIPIGNIVIDAQGTIQLANPAAQMMFGYTAAELVGKNVSILMPEPDRGRHDGYIERYLETGVKKILGSSREVSGLRKNGEVFPVRLALGEMFDAEHRTFVGSVIDLSHIKSLEAQLIQSQKMEAIGQLAGGIAHDFNNLLHVINGFAEIARSALPADAPVQLELSQIALAGERAAALTGQLLAFSRRQVMEPDNIDPNEVISKMGGMLRRVIGEHIQLDILASPRLGRIYADQGMIEQVLMNLCVNARDAMKAGGRLNIETENVLISDEYCRDHVWAKPGRYVLISVTDTGCGMDRETLEHIFEPFFTTKGMHEGTGLGLSMVYGIVKQHDGMINVYSEVDKGTTFKVYLPHSERAAQDVGTKIEGEVPRGTETILVVEDDEAVRGLTRTVLESAGYTVIEAENGHQALEAYRLQHERIHLALLDVVMPGMGGRDAYRAMLEIDPDLKALFASGYSENAIHTNFVLDSGLVLLKKPYSRDDLLRAIRRILDQ
jgi:PAS domain S-box-containing protein